MLVHPRRAPRAGGRGFADLDARADLNPLWVFLGYGEKPGIWALAGGAVVIAAVVLRTFCGNDQGKLIAADE
jgi:hypothetical protein